MSTLINPVVTVCGVVRPKHTS